MSCSLSKAFLVLTFLIFIALPQGVFAATLYFSPSQSTQHVGENFKASLLVSSDQPVNAFSGVLNFPTETLEIIAISKINSIINLWVQEPSFSNSGRLGNAYFEGVILNPGFKGLGGRIIEVVFRVKKEGSATIRLTDFAVLANDGFGTNLITTAGEAKFTFLPPLSSKPDSAEVAPEKGPAPVIIVKEAEIPPGILGFWYVLPNFIKVGILVFIGTASLILFLVVLSFGIIALIWIWGNLGHRREKFGKWVQRLPLVVEKFFRNIFVLIGWAEKEILNDIEYSILELKKDIIEAKDGVSFGKMLEDYWGSIKRIIRRFFSKNKEIERANQPPEDEYDDSNNKFNEITDSNPKSR